MKQPISSIMDSDVYTCHQSESLEDVVRILVDKQIGGLTVVDDGKHVVGFISDGDIMKAIAKQKTRMIYGGDSVMVFYDDDAFDEKLGDLKNRNVMTLATRNVVCASPNMPIDEVARLLSKKKIKKIPIVNNEGFLVGIARRSTILRYVFSILFTLAPSPED